MGTAYGNGVLQSDKTSNLEADVPSAPAVSTLESSVNISSNISSDNASSEPVSSELNESTNNESSNNDVGTNEDKAVNEDNANKENEEECDIEEADDDLNRPAETIGSTIRVAMYDQPSAQNVSMIVAASLGLYEKQGLPPVEFIWRNENKDVFDFLRDHEAEFAVSWLAEGIVARTEGRNVIAISRCNQYPSLAFFIWNGKNPSLKKIENIQGRKVGFNFRSDLTGKAFLYALGIKTDEYIFRSESVLVLTTGGVDCVAMPTFRFEAIQKYLRIRDQFTVFQVKDYPYNFPESMIFCRHSFYHDQKDICRKFVLASFQGAQYALEHKEQAVELLSNYFRNRVYLDKFILEKQVSKWLESLELQPDPQNNGFCYEKNYNALVEAMVGAELVDPDLVPSYSECFHDVLKHANVAQSESDSRVIPPDESSLNQTLPSANGTSKGAPL